MTQRTQQSVLFEDTFTKPVHVAFDAEALSSDGGLTLLSALDRGIGLSQDLIVALVDPRDGTRIDYTFAELFGQRCLGIAQAYADGNDAARLSGDPMLKLALGRDPITGDDLASQSTISRFENTITARQDGALGSRQKNRYIALTERCAEMIKELLDGADSFSGDQALVD